VRYDLLIVEITRNMILQRVTPIRLQDIYRILHELTACHALKLEAVCFPESYLIFFARLHGITLEKTVLFLSEVLFITGSHEDQISVLSSKSDWKSTGSTASNLMSKPQCHSFRNFRGSHTIPTQWSLSIRYPCLPNVLQNKIHGYSFSTLKARCYI